uniref:Uncharacterized protein n=1 Tax=Carnobacterium maltaromaticum TaxID=2751 RepID=A0A1Z5AYU4_CARML|nr:protein of unknown function [Carnobacterium maltaromaticum]
MKISDHVLVTEHQLIRFPSRFDTDSTFLGPAIGLIERGIVVDFPFIPGMVVPNQDIGFR